MENNKKKYLLFKKRKGEIDKILFKNINWCEVDRNVVSVIDIFGIIHKKKMSLIALIGLLDDDFMQVHESFVVKKNRIARQNEDQFRNLWIYLKTKKNNEYQKISVSRDYKKIVKVLISQNKRIKEYK